jgi:hypothetical protein
MRPFGTGRLERGRDVAGRVRPLFWNPIWTVELWSCCDHFFMLLSKSSPTELDFAFASRAFEQSPLERLELVSCFASGLSLASCC